MLVVWLYQSYTALHLQWSREWYVFTKICAFSCRQVWNNKLLKIESRFKAGARKSSRRERERRILGRHYCPKWLHVMTTSFYSNSKRSISQPNPKQTIKIATVPVTNIPPPDYWSYCCSSIRLIRKSNSDTILITLHANNRYITHLQYLHYSFPTVIWIIIKFKIENNLKSTGWKIWIRNKN